MWLSSLTPEPRFRMPVSLVDLSVGSNPACSATFHFLVHRSPQRIPRQVLHERHAALGGCFQPILITAWRQDHHHAFFIAWFVKRAHQGMALQRDDELIVDRRRLTSALDGLNQRYSRGTLLMASAGLAGNRRAWSMKQERRTPGYTTCWDDLAVARA